MSDEKVMLEENGNNRHRLHHNVRTNPRPCHPLNHARLPLLSLPVSSRRGPNRPRRRFNSPFAVDTPPPTIGVPQLRITAHRSKCNFQRWLAADNVSLGFTQQVATMML
jgi:hypothetical protein